MVFLSQILFAIVVQLSRGTGQPTCVAVGKFMAVGLSTGTVLVFGKIY